MRYIFKFPDIGEGIAEGKILTWYVKKGQEIKFGDPIVKMETDKVVTDIPSPRDGVIAAVFGNEGEVINVGDPLVEIEIEGVEGEAAREVVAEAAEVPKHLTEEPIAEKGFGVVGTLEVAGDSAYLPAGEEGRPSAAAPAEAPPRKALATPVARAMAKDMGIDIDKTPGTGPGGRVMKKDITAYYENLQKGEVKPKFEAAPSPVSRLEYQPLSQIRKTIAKNMTRSKHNAAHMTVFEEVEVSALVKLRADYKEKFANEGLKFSYMPLFLKAVAEGLKSHPVLNSQLDLENNRMIYKKFYNINIAVDTEEGLVVPVVRDADKISIREMTIKIAEIAEKARERKLTLDDMKDGTFTVTNYGAIAGTYGVPVINYPQVAILGIGRILKEPVVKNDEIVVGHVLPLSLSVDHRIVDGGDAARFILRVKELLSDPVSLLLV